jgi:hypothetical protein
VVEQPPRRPPPPDHRPGDLIAPRTARHRRSDRTAGELIGPSRPTDPKPLPDNHGVEELRPRPSGSRNVLATTCCDRSCPKGVARSLAVARLLWGLQDRGIWLAPAPTREQSYQPARPRGCGWSGRGSRLGASLVAALVAERSSAPGQVFGGVAGARYALPRGALKGQGRRWRASSARAGRARWR